MGKIYNTSNVVQIKFLLVFGRLREIIHFLWWITLFVHYSIKRLLFKITESVFSFYLKLHNFK